MMEARTLFGEPCLVIAWGHIGSRCRVRTEAFSSRVNLVRRRSELLARRRQHGSGRYPEVACLLGRDERGALSDDPIPIGALGPSAR